MSFSLFAAGLRTELGRGGRYRAGSNGDGEPATGCTLFLDSVLSALPRAEPRPRIFVPSGTPVEDARRLRADGWATVCGLEAADPETAAKRLGCTHMFVSGKISSLA